MIKALIKNKVVSLHQGDLDCTDLELLKGINLLFNQFELQIHDYHPQPELQRMEWICQKTKGSILFADEPDEIDPHAEY